ncbi:restriction endonuclease subunit R [Halioglobus japonicus]|uniref:Restriction endonuclease subunit R n=1 Tax=Halioglobus japonicus TaxID=930805 RepID=A0AAP8MGH1_9GAMM|nr:DEAD/DEAH box helicase family protein [Halioglobus japonicus]AQA20227.1 restriction endonuclease subunit R [Halioglobus japonicus]PLW86974.1 restriction endonuclease subunit R [Halioglobus japonicus]
MKSINFELIRPYREELADLGGLAEFHLYVDPGSALVKLRSFAEYVVKDIYVQERLPKLHRPQLIDLMKNDAFMEVVDRSLLNHLHYLRIQGNGPAHGEPAETSTAKIALGIAHQVASYLAIRYYGVSLDSIPEFQTPENIADTESLQREKTSYKKLAEKQADEVERLLAELDALRAKLDAEPASSAEREQSLRASQSASAALTWDEAKTRTLMIDALLGKARWDIGNTDEVGIEFEVQHQPTASGIGYADYVLWGDNGLPLAVIEAKKSGADLSLGREQARMYADGLEKMTGQRPIIFYSNGYETHLWDDVQYNSARKVYGFYDKESLEYLIFQRSHRDPAPEQDNPDLSIADRAYQIEAIKTVAGHFQQQRRKALLVQATGTGKTRVAIAIVELLLRKRWLKRVLFLCDRNELRKQAGDAFKTHLPSETRCIIGAGGEVDPNARIYVATYPGMMNRFEQFNVGFFDLIIADESHRSIYNKYRDLFTYFDALQLGLTATPVKFIARNTFDLFGCENQDPTFEYTLEQAINNVPPHLVPFRVKDLTTGFLREGIKYEALSEEQREQLDEQTSDAEDFNYQGKDIGKRVFNKDTDRIILQNLINNGLRDDTGSLVGKTVVFAVNQNHAEALQKTFVELYPQYGDAVCKVIHNKVPRAEALIDEFKQPGNNFRIAISVDMLDTGVDVPALVNLVFAKPVKSWVKFWQMIGRGTRLCPDLFGPGKDKREFLIFDHYGNFEYFNESYQEADTGTRKSLLQWTFEARLELAEGAVEAGNRDAFDTSCKLMRSDINDLPQNSVQVRDNLRDVHILQQPDIVEVFEAATVSTLRETIAPLMGQRTLSDKDAIRFDRLMAELQLCFVKGAACLEEKRLELLARVDRLAITIKAVRDKDALIKALRTSEWWDAADFAALEQVRTELRGIMRYQQALVQPGGGIHRIDVTEDVGEIREHDRTVDLTRTESLAYRFRIKTILEDMFDVNPTLQKIYNQEPVTDAELESLTSLVLTQNPGVDISLLVDFFPEAQDLHQAVSQLIGLDPEKVDGHFTEFMHEHPQLTPLQVKFLNLMKTHIATNGYITLGKLYEAPFTHLHAMGLDGIFPVDTVAEDLVKVMTPYVRPESDGSAEVH